MTTHDAMMLPVALDLAAAPALLEAIRSALRTTPMLRLDASQVETLTLPCAQILVSAAP